MSVVLAAPQPIRAWPIYDQLPAGCIAFAVPDDDSWPLAAAGEFVVVDTDQRELETGELFVIESGRTTPNPRQRIVEAFTRPLNDPTNPGAAGWWVGAYARPRTPDAARALVARGRMMMVDGPYAAGRDEAYLTERLVGKVVGVLASSPLLAASPSPLLLAAPHHG